MLCKISMQMPCPAYINGTFQKDFGHHFTSAEINTIFNKYEVKIFARLCHKSNNVHSDAKGLEISMSFFAVHAGLLRIIIALAIESFSR